MIIGSAVCKSYESKSVLHNVSFSMDTSKLYRLEGVNGSGKTTLLRILVDLVKPNSGEILINGKTNSDIKIEEYFGCFLGNNTVIPFLRAEEYFELINNLRGNSTDLKTFYADLKGFFNHEVLSKKGSLATFSSGNKAKVGIAAAFIGNPQFLVLDEPFAHLDANASSELKSLLKGRYWNGNGGGIVSVHGLISENEIFDHVIYL